ncbi:MAG: hypothetical protein C4538_12120 [Nitrospiraceae bacterium]|nr:MAG: hypothetical protein C4538_12120 [Nitrospiraceae bacterium]
MRATENLKIKIVLFIIIYFLMPLGYSPAPAEVKLKSSVPGLCYECHRELKEKLSSPAVHFLFREGKCLTCHNSHAGNVKGLMDDVNSVCIGCHEKIRNLLKSQSVHSPLRDDLCTKCHYPHSGNYTNLLVNAEKDLCIGCHENIEAQMDKPYGCSPFKKGQCSSCHNSHGSSEEFLLISAPNKLCRECHAPRCRAGEVSIVSEVAVSDCTSCHSGHGSQIKGALGPYGHKAFLDKECSQCHNPITPGSRITTKKEGEGVCLDCHKKDDSQLKYVSSDIHVKDAKNSCVVCHDSHASGKKSFTASETKICSGCHEKTERNTAAMEKALKSVGCAPVKNRKCFECHIPMHSDRPLNYRDDEIAMCVRCHESQHKVTHPVGPNIVDPRSGGPVTCNSCHSMHAARADFMLTADRNRALCIQCHRM